MENENVASRPSPRFAVGDWAYNPHKNHNARVVNVEWDKAMHGYQGGWRYWVPGLGDPHMMAERKDRPYVEYEQVNAHCWKEVK